MKISRTWAMPNSKTFTIKPIKELVEKYVEIASGGGNYHRSVCKFV